MSSSISSQWIPIPGPMNLQFNRCWGVAFRSRGNHSKGVLTRRPSTKVTSSESSVISTSIALASALVLPVASNVVIPCPSYQWFVLFNQLSDLFKLLAAKAIRLRQHNRIHPEFGIVLGILNVNVDWFLRFTAEKEESVSLISENFWHEATVSGATREESVYFLRTSPVRKGW